ncbi:MAG: lysoplasmalogenase family protein [Promethearchaeota archaeon]
MNEKIKSYLKWIIYLIALAVIILEITRIVVLSNAALANIIRYIESILVSVAAVLIRLFLDPEKTISAIRETDIEKESFKSGLNASRFLNIMPIAMIVCTTADFILGEVDFLFGLITFLVAQVLLMVAFSGLIHYRNIFTGKIKVLAIISTIVLVSIFLTIYITVIYSVEDTLTIIVIPYLFCILIMCVSTFFALGYKGRDIIFRVMLCIGGISFLISDTILGIRLFMDKSHFITPINIPDVWVLLTYNIAIFCLQYAVLFLGNQRLREIKKNIK